MNKLKNHWHIGTWKYLKNREPGENTIAYYPLEKDILDYSGNGRNLSMYSGSFSYEELSSWKKICRVNTSSQTNNLTIPFNRTGYTVSCYATFDTIDSKYQKILLDFVSWSNYFPRVYDISYQWRSIVSGIVSFDDYWASYVQNKWYYIVSVYENNVAFLYINWQLIHSVTYSDSSTTWILTINWVNDHRTNYRCWWWLSEVIFEKKARTLQEITNNFNLTKSSYWI